MPRMGFEPTNPAFKRWKTVHALDRAATVIGSEVFTAVIIRVLVLGLLRRVILLTVTDVSEEHAISIFRYDVCRLRYFLG
jgi:hypothetical protein